MRKARLVWLLTATVLMACGGSESGTLTYSRTPTPTNTPSAPTPAAGAAVHGLVLLRNDVPTAPTDSLGTPPPAWQGIAIGEPFGRTLAHATLNIEGAQTSVSVDASADGSFVLPELPPGIYRLHLTKVLNGNLIEASVPLSVGEQGATVLIIEVGWGQVRSRSRYQKDGRDCEEVRVSDGPYRIRCDGRVVEFGDGFRAWVDEDGDGTFAPQNCAATLWNCDFEQGCEDGSACHCTSSCPACDDCGPGLCSAGSLPYAYRCGEAGRCADPGDQCVCVASCPTCTDCSRQVCVPSCELVRIDALLLGDPLAIAVGRIAYPSATLQLSDGKLIDVTGLVDWASGDPSVAIVDETGSVRGVAPGATQIVAVWDDTWTVRLPVQVVEGFAVRRVFVVNALCQCGPVWLSDPAIPVRELPCLLRAPEPDASLPPVPWCRDVVRIGSSLRFLAFAEFADGSVEEVTEQAEWSVEPAGAGELQAGRFVPRQVGTVEIRASFRGSTSEPLPLRVVDRPTPVGLFIAADRAFADRDPTLGAPSSGTVPECIDCSYQLTVLIGEQVQFRATAEYDTGEWQDVTESVSWNAAPVEVLSFGPNGLATANAAGSAAVEATFGELRSNTLRIRLVSEATPLALWIQPEATDRVLARGAEMFFHAFASYDVGMVRDVTPEATWRSSDESVASFSRPGVLTGIGAGTVEVTAELRGLRSQPFAIEVYETSELNYCDPEHVNRAVWTDGFNRVVLESDCGHYEVPGLVTLRYTVTESRPRGGVFDPCLDLYVFRGGTLVRTLREEGCGAPFLAADAPGREAEVLRYQTRAVWDLRDASGNFVPDGVYRIYGRFYLYYDPVISLDVVVGTPSPEPTPGPATGGCFIGDCSGSILPNVDRDACCSLARSSMHPLPYFWCDWIVGGRCVVAACQAPCDSEPNCCPPNALCPMHIPPCPPPSCCPAGEDCGGLALPPCPEKCCPAGLLCIPELPPCPSPSPSICGGIAGFACPEGFVCNLTDPSCATADLAGSCVARPSACTALYAPVCGCDGETYKNDCERLSSGAVLRHGGPCVTN